MAEYPPPPPRPGSTRPGVVTAAAILLIVAGGLSVLVGLLLLAGAGRAAGAGVGGLFAVLAIMSLAVGALQIYAGIQVLNLRSVGRTLGIALAAIGAVFALLSIGRTTGTNIIGIAIDVFIIWALVTNADVFTP